MVFKTAGVSHILERYCEGATKTVADIEDVVFVGLHLLRRAHVAAVAVTFPTASTQTAGKGNGQHQEDGKQGDFFHVTGTVWVLYCRSVTPVVLQASILFHQPYTNNAHHERDDIPARCETQL